MERVLFRRKRCLVRPTRAHRGRARVLLKTPLKGLDYIPFDAIRTALLPSAEPPALQGLV
jgi:hypothetical protein